MTNIIKAGAATVVFLISILTGYTLGFNQAQAMWENKIKSELLCK